MGLIGLLVFLLIFMISVQIFLSCRKNRYAGLVIPVINILIATILGMMGTDYFIGYFVLITLALPLVIWMGIYKFCRFRVNEKTKDDMKKMKIKDL